MRKLYALIPAVGLVLAAACAEQATDPVLVMTVDAPAFAVDKATGGAMIDHHMDDWYFDFNAFEAVGDDPEAKGYRQAKGQLHHYSPTVPRDLQIDIKYVAVESNEAWFVGQAVEDTNGGLLNAWIVVKVVDNGEGGDAPHDLLVHEWFPTDRYANPEAEALAVLDGRAVPHNPNADVYSGCGEYWCVVEGNLQVHEY